MTGFDVFKRCMVLLGYSPESNEVVDNKTLINRMPDIINQIALDLKIPQIFSLSEKININEAKIDALCCGCAMLLALTEGDSGKNQIFTAIYNAKRASVLSQKVKKEDVLPSVRSGGI